MGAYHLLCRGERREAIFLDDKVEHKEQAS